MTESTAASCDVIIILSPITKIVNTGLWDRTVFIFLIKETLGTATSESAHS